jgi:hypothetical protein
MASPRGFTPRDGRTDFSVRAFQPQSAGIRNRESLRAITPEDLIHAAFRRGRTIASKRCTFPSASCWTRSARSVNPFGFKGPRVCPPLKDSFHERIEVLSSGRTSARKARIRSSMPVNPVAQEIAPPHCLPDSPFPGTIRVSSGLILR